MSNDFDPSSLNGKLGPDVHGMVHHAAVHASMQASVHAAGFGSVDALLAAGAKAMTARGDLPTARHWFELAYRAAQATGDPHAAAVAALGLGGPRVHQHRTLHDAAVFGARLRQALSLVEPNSDLGVRLRARLAAEADYRAGNCSAVLAVLAEARAATDPVARFEVLSLAHQCAAGPGNGPLRRELANELLDAAIMTGRRTDLLHSVLCQATDHLLAGSSHAQRRLGEVRELLVHRDHRTVRFVLSATEVLLSIRAGQLDAAEQLARACERRGCAAGDVDTDGWLWAQLTAIRWYQGRIGELQPMLGEAVHSPDLSVVDRSCVAALALAAAQAGDSRTAAGALARVAGRDLGGLPRTTGWLVTLGTVVEAAYLLEDTELAAQAYDLLVPFRHLPMVAGLGAACLGSVHHALGVASLTGGQLDRAVHHLGAAVHDNLALGHWPAAALSRQRYAQALARRDGSPGGAMPALAAVPAARAVGGVAAVSGVSGVPALGAVAAGTGAATLPDEPPGLAATCVRDGLQWRLELAGRSVLVGHAVGLLHLAVLLANPGTDVPSVELAAGVAAVGNRNARAGQSVQPVLDRSAIQDYRRRLEDLRTQIEELEADRELDRAAQLRSERDWLMAELAAGAGLAGRTRRFPDDKERARLAVGRAIRRAIARIARADAEIGAHLQRRIHTGLHCVYRPGGPANPAS